MKGRPGIAKRDTLHPIVEQLFAAAHRQNITMQAIADVTGMARETLSHWQHRRREPSLMAVEMALNAVNLGLTVAPLQQDKPAQSFSFRKQLLSRGKVRHGPIPRKMQQRLREGVHG